MGGLRLVWVTGVRDLQWRLRRFLIAIGGVALVFAVTLLLSGFRSAFVHCPRTDPVSGST